MNRERKLTCGPWSGKVTPPSPNGPLSGPDHSCCRERVSQDGHSASHMMERSKHKKEEKASEVLSSLQRKKHRVSIRRKAYEAFFWLSLNP